MPDPPNQDVSISSGESLSKERSAFRKTSERIFSLFLEDKKSGFLENLQMQLDRADMDLSSAAYTSEVFFLGLIVGIVFAIVALTAYLLKFHPPVVALALPTSIILVIGIGLYLPQMRSSSRGKKIDENLGSALAFISAMSNADVPINTIMVKLSSMNEYGEVSREASKIANRTELMGMDIFSAIEEVARKSPSVEWQKFLQGAVTASAAGARLKPYFVNKAMEYQNMLRVSLKKNSESVSVFAETYVTIGVAFPLFLIVILAVMSVIARNASGATISFLLVFSFLVLPVMIAAFVLVISSVNKEVNIS
ncbi:MAG: type II secretion system F protein [Thermoplasmatales archaeon I-plasma]|nr:MAG: type II secretion system F protein [Thermoplasmatales archaeon I-plasma]